MVKVIKKESRRTLEGRSLAGGEGEGGIVNECTGLRQTSEV